MFTPIDDANMPKTMRNQAHTCKTLGIVTKPKWIASTHAQMLPRNIFTRAQLTSYSRPRPVPKALGVVASSKVPRVHVTWSTTLLSNRASKFLTTVAYSFVFAARECDQTCLSIRILSGGALYRHKDGLGSPWKVFIVITFDPCEIHTFLNLEFVIYIL